MRFGWGLEDLHRLAPVSDAVVLVDVLRFTTAVSVAVSRGAVVLPYRWRDETAAAYAEDQRAVLAGLREHGSWSLSPTDLARIPAGTRIVLPSPNGATLSVEAAALTPTVLAGCPRNAGAVAAHLAGAASVAVIASGERWPGADGPHTGALRPAVEDLLGAGAVLHALGSARTSSPEARAAVSAYRGVTDLAAELRASVSGHELAARGWDDDVLAAAQVDVDACAPLLRNGAYLAG